MRLAATTLVLLGAVFTIPAHATFYHLWSHGYGDSLFQHVDGVGVGPDGSVYIAGDFDGTINLGGDTFTDGDVTLFLARLDADGRHIWSRAFSRWVSAKGLVVDASGNVVVTGEIIGNADFGGGLLSSAGGNDVYVAAFDADGNHLWSEVFGTARDEFVDGIALDPTGGVVITGRFSRLIHFGDVFLGTAGGWDVFVVKLNAAGEPVWGKSFGDALDQRAERVAVSPDGHIALASNGPETIRYLDTDGSLLWSHAYESGWLYTGALATDRQGGLVVSGAFKDRLDLGGRILVQPPNPAWGFLLALDANGSYQWSTVLGDTSGAAYATALAIDDESDVFLAANLIGTIALDGTYLTGVPPSLLLAELDSTGHLLNSRVVGGNAGVAGAALGPAERMVVGGYYVEPTDLGGGILPFGGKLDAFVASYSLQDPNYTAIAAFSAAFNGTAIDTRWQLATSEPLGAYRLVRRSDRDSAWTAVDSGSAAGSQGYSDANVTVGRTYDYRLFVTTTTGGDYASAIATVPVPSAKTALMQNAPNPFAGQTTIPYTLEGAADVTIDIFDVTGRRVARLKEGERAPGPHTALWNGRNGSGRPLASGVYFYRLVGSGVGVKKMILVR